MYLYAVSVKPIGAIVACNELRYLMQIVTIEVFLADRTTAVLAPPQSHTFFTILVATNLLILGVNCKHGFARQPIIPLGRQLRTVVDR